MEIDLEEDAQSSASEDFVEVGDTRPDSMEVHVGVSGELGHEQGGQEPGEVEDAGAGDESGQDMPSLPGSPLPGLQPEDPTQPPDSQASQERVGC